MRYKWRNRVGLAARPLKDRKRRPPKSERHGHHGPDKDRYHFGAGTADEISIAVSRTLSEFEETAVVLTLLPG